MRKKRILFCSEFSALNTGFSKMGREIISRIARTEKYEVAELANFGHPADPRGKSLPWKYYGVMPDNEGDPAYACKSTNAFGEWRYEDTLLDFKPDVVISWLDIWMTAHQATSPLRPHYNLLWTTTCDGEPQDEEWIDLLTKCDGVFTYTDWAHEVLKKQGGRQINLLGRNSPGVDHNIFHPVQNKQAYKNPTLSNDEMLVVGTVMRNQKRKLYPDLILAFKKFLKYASERDRALANRTYLYLHTGYPDVGWDIPRLIKESGIGHKILITYICRDCKTCFPSLFKDARAQCAACGKFSAGLTNVGHGVSEEALAQIYNIFDVYVQYSLCLTKDQEIKTPSGWKKIQDIKVGEQVFTHKNRYRPVKRLFTNLDIGKKVLKITPWSDFNSLELTENHPILCLTREDIGGNKNLSIRENIGSLRRLGKDLPEPSFKEAGKLLSGDLICLPIDDIEKDPEPIDLYTINSSQKTTEKYIYIKGGKKHSRFINIDENFAKFVGFFAAEGYSNKYSIKLTFHNKEQKYKKIIANTIKNFGEKPSIRSYIGREAFDIGFNSSLHAQLFTKLFYSGKQKKLPDFVMTWPKELQKHILYGLCAGDGCNRENCLIYGTVSKELAQQVRILLHRLRVPHNSKIRKRESPRQDMYVFEIYSDILNFVFTGQSNKGMTIYNGNNAFVKIKSIEEINYNDTLYNFEVEEDNSYVTRIGAVHNCEGFGMPITEAASCGTPVFYTDCTGMRDFTKTLNGFPIKVQRFFREAETHRFFGLPDEDDFAAKLFNFLCKPVDMRKKRGFETRLSCEKNYSWDKSAEKYMKYVDGIPFYNWDGPTKLHQPRETPPHPDNNEKFVEDAIMNILGDPSYLNSYMAAKIINDLNYSARMERQGGFQVTDLSFLGMRPQYKPYGRQDVVNELLEMANNKNYWEQVRVGQVNRITPDFIKIANS